MAGAGRAGGAMVSGGLWSLMGFLLDYLLGYLSLVDVMQAHSNVNHSTNHTRGFPPLHAPITGNRASWRDPWRRNPAPAYTVRDVSLKSQEPSSLA
jgi:hypothetical protein